MPVSTIERPNTQVRQDRLPEALATEPKEQRKYPKRLATTAATTVRVQPAQVVQETRDDFFSRAARALHTAAFQSGLTGPYQVSYRDSRQLSAKEKAEIDILLQGYFL